MKKLLMLLCMGVLLVGIAGCGNTESGDGDDSSQVQGSDAPEISQTPETPVISDVPAISDVPTGGSAATDHNYEEGWTEEMEAVKTAVIAYLGEDYWPNAAMYPEILESLIGITPDMYEDYLAEMPMISVNVDMLIVVKALEDQVDTVEQILLDYYDKNVNQTMMYPQNVGKIQAARVECIGNYVVFAQLGADTTEISEDGDQEVIIAHCQEVNDQVIEIISNVIQH